ncbi:MAG: hypothetical protein HY293_03850 [Planctomycetes bacterium]|nr:hypothetical protein [Planctomycetota bacterium]
MGRWARILGASLALCGTVWAQERAQDRTLTFVFKDASIDAVLLYVSQVTGWIFVQEAPLRGTITAFSRAEVPASRCLEFLDACLRPHGLTVRNAAWPRPPVSGETVRVIELSQAQPGVHVGVDAAEIPVTDELRTQILPLKHVGAADVGKDFGELLKKAVGEGGQIAVSAYSNSIVLTGRSEGIHRVAEILRVIDQTASAQLRISVIPLVHADAVEVAKTLNEIVKREPAKAEAGGQQVPAFLRMMRAGTEAAAPRSLAHEVIRISAEPRMNAIIVSATEENLELIQAVLRRLDQPTAALNTYVVSLKNADAATVAAILQALWNEQKARTTTPNAVRSDGTAAPGQAPFANQPSSSGARRPGSTAPRR